jgi:hypothetical protein
MAKRIQLRRDTEANWQAANPVIAEGEMCLSMNYTPPKMKIGNGTSHWSNLDYVSYSSGGTTDPSTVTIGTVTTGISPSVENSGTPTQAILDFVFPVGGAGSSIFINIKDYGAKSKGRGEISRRGGGGVKESSNSHNTREICRLCQKPATGASGLRPKKDRLKNVGRIWFFNAPCL